MQKWGKLLRYPSYRRTKSQAVFIKNNARFVSARERAAIRPKRAVAHLSFVLMAITFVFAANNANKHSEGFHFHFPAVMQSATINNSDLISAVTSLNDVKNNASANIIPAAQTEETAIGNSPLKYVAAKISNSIFSSGAKVGLSGKAISNFINIFREEINFGKDVHSGDEFAILSDDKGNIQAAEITTKNKIYRAIAFTDNDGHVNYYAPNGYNLAAAFMRYPLQYKHVSSKFSLHRYHPILHKYCAHLGVDLAADAGSPIKATSDGVIEFAGIKDNYGKVVIVAHHQYSTLYAHLSKLGNIKTGSSVKQGTVIGYLGSTGLSTGPHVHYEFRINGVHYDPQKVKLPHDMIASSYRSKFLVQANTMVALLNSHNSNSMYAQNSNSLDGFVER